MSRLLPIGTLLIPILAQSVTAIAQQNSATDRDVTGRESNPQPVVATMSDSAGAGGSSMKLPMIHAQKAENSCPGDGCPADRGVGQAEGRGCPWPGNRFPASSHSTCGMPPHYPYFPSLHGYYYFRPYHHSHLAEQQHLAAQWGEDPRMPYANATLKRVRETYEQERRELVPAVSADSAE